MNDNKLDLVIGIGYFLIGVLNGMGCGVFVCWMCGLCGVGGVCFGELLNWSVLVVDLWCVGWFGGVGMWG